MTTSASHMKHSFQTQRNFLRENRLLVSQTPMATALRRLQRDLDREQEQELERKRKQFHYTLPTNASLTRQAGTLKLLETQRRLLQGGRQVKGAFYVNDKPSRSQSEKQIQTEDIWDEQFLNAALLKCCRHSEGDEPYFGPSNENENDNDTDNDNDAGACLRRTASNFELGRVYPLQYKRRPLDGSLPAQLELERKMELGEKQQQQAVLQLAIPDITDVEQEPQLDHNLSARTNASSNEMPQINLDADADAATAAAANGERDSQQQQKEEQRDKAEQQQKVMLTEPQRIEWLAAAQARQRQLIWEYNRLPLSMGTLRVRRLKVQLEQQLDRIDSDLRMLSSPQACIGRDKLQQISSISC